MKSDSKPYVPFSQRVGLEPIPPQLKLGEVSDDLRRLLDYSVALEIGRETDRGYNVSYFKAKWKRVASDLHVVFFKKAVATFRPDPSEIHQRLRRIIEGGDIGQLFNLIEFLVRHSGCSIEFKSDVRDAFANARAAYRVLDGCIVAIGTEDQAAAFARAIADVEANNATAARKHLVDAGLALRNSDWSGSVRESIHAVEATAVRLAPNTKTLGDALKVLEKRSHIHGSLKSAFDKLYGYASDEEGVRHALVLKDAPQVDETDALFMLGACASFVSYLLARS